MKLRYLAGILTLACSSTLYADTIAQWTFETNTPADLSNSATGPTVNAEAGVGLGSLVGVHASAASDWTTPAGNGSLNSYSVNTWAIDDYYEFQTSSLGFEDIRVTFDQTSSNTGPKDFKLQYSTDGSLFTDFASYAVTATSWSSAAPVAGGTTSYSFDLSSISALDNDASVYFRLTLTSTNPANATSTFGAGGTNRIDNVVVSGTSLSVVPLPPAVFGGLGLMGLMAGWKRLSVRRPTKSR